MDMNVRRPVSALNFRVYADYSRPFLADLMSCLLVMKSSEIRIPIQSAALQPRITCIGILIINLFSRNEIYLLQIDASHLISNVQVTKGTMTVHRSRSA
jgi:hypothetical protein